jgi:hypothetical protein
MRRMAIGVLGLSFLSSVGLLVAGQAPPAGGSDKTKVDAAVRRFIKAVDPERMSKHLFYLAKDPLPYRKLNLTLPGHSKNTLYEADDYLAGKLEAAGYDVEREGVQVQAFRRDTTKPKNAQYSPPKPEDPWYTAYNLYAEKKGRSHPEKIIVVCAHKDSQSWIDSPGANDNAIGTVGQARGQAARRVDGRGKHPPCHRFGTADGGEDKARRRRRLVCPGRLPRGHHQHRLLALRRPGVPRGGRCPGTV